MLAQSLAAHAKAPTPTHLLDTGRRSLCFTRAFRGCKGISFPPYNKTFHSFFFVWHSRADSREGTRRTQRTPNDGQPTRKLSADKFAMECTPLFQGAQLSGIPVAIQSLPHRNPVTFKLITINMTQQRQKTSIRMALTSNCKTHGIIDLHEKHASCRWNTHGEHSCHWPAAYKQAAT